MEKEFTIKSVTPFGKTKIATWKAADASIAVKEFLDANPAYKDNKKGTIIAESIAKARIDIGKDDIDDAYMDVNYAISRDTNYTLKEFKKESMSTKQLLEAANRKCEMRWKVLAFDPAEDNKLVKEFKDFDCIDCAAAKKREYLEKNPTHVVEIISESKAQKNEDRLEPNEKEGKIKKVKKELDDLYYQMARASASGIEPPQSMFDRKNELIKFLKASESAQKNEDFKNPKTHDELKPGEWYEVEGRLYQIADRQPIDNEVQAFKVFPDYSVGNGVHVLYKSFYKPDKFKFVNKKDKITKIIKEKEAQIAKLKQEIDALKRNL